MSKYSSTALTRKREQFLSSWKEHAPEVSFSGMTLEEFETRSEAPIEIRKEITDKRTRLKGLILEREKADDAMNDDFIRIAHAIRADQAYGEDSALYRSLGFVPKSERRSGRRSQSSSAQSKVTDLRAEEENAA